MCLDLGSYLLGKSKGGGGGSNLQTKSVTITENKTTTVSPDAGYDGLDTVTITTNVPSVTPTGTISITQNGTVDVTNYASANVNVPADVSAYFRPTISKGVGNVSGIEAMIKTIPATTTVSGNDLSYAFSGCAGLIEIPLIDTSEVYTMLGMFMNCTSLTTIPALNTENVESFQQMFYQCSSLVSVPLFDTSTANAVQSMFSGCTSLTTVPQFNLSEINSASKMSQMFQGCTSLTTESLNNILGMCATSGVTKGTKTLAYIFGNEDMSQYYPASTIQGLSNYQAFVTAGWSIDWS